MIDEPNNIGRYMRCIALPQPGPAPAHLTFKTFDALEERGARVLLLPPDDAVVMRVSSFSQQLLMMRTV